MGALTEDRDWVYGMQLPIQTLTASLADPWEADASPADLVSVAQRAEATGHSFIGVCDHIALPDDDYAKNMSTTWYDTVATLGFLAASTSTIHLASTVWVAAYRHPLQTAKSFATLDHLSGGRAILGVGAGHVAGEFEALGVDMKRRGALTDEVLEVVNKVFTSSHVAHSGENFEFEAMGVGPRPVGGELTTWVGGKAPAAWRRAGRHAHGWIPMGNRPSQYPEIIETIRGAAAEAGHSDRPFDLGYMPGWARLTGDEPEGAPMVMHSRPEDLAAEIRKARSVGANVMHLKLRGVSLADHLEQLDAFRELVVPLVEEP